MPGTRREAITAAGIGRLHARVIRRHIPSREQLINQVIIPAPLEPAVLINQVRQTPQDRLIRSPEALRLIGQHRRAGQAAFTTQAVQAVPRAVTVQAVRAVRPAAIVPPGLPAQ